MSPRCLVAAVACVVFAGAAVACLPGDDRPEPGRLLVTAAPSEATTAGFATDDGWSVRLDRFVAAMGDVDLDGVNERRNGADEAETCVDYSETNYEWLIDFVQAEREKVGLVFGLGTCTIEYRLRGPSRDTVLGTGATEDDLEVMFVEESDAWSEDEAVTLVVVGSATRGDVTKSFRWMFRNTYEIRRCVAPSGGRDASRVELTAGVEREIPLVVRGEELFRRGVGDELELQFDWFADADADGDGEVTLDELDGVPVPAEALPIPPPVGEEEDAPPPPDTLGDLVYEHLLPRVTRVEGGGPCDTELRD